MSNPPRHIAVVDLECTCSNTNAGDDTVRRDQMETIEIGAVMVRRHDFEPVDEFCRFIHPVVHHELTDFCKELTSITQHDVNAAPLFHEVYWRFAEWLTDWQAAAWGSWGAFDAYQLQLDARRQGLEHELDWLPPHCNIKSSWAKQMGMKRVGLGRAVQTAGLEFEGRAHRGIDDARMIGRLLRGVGWPRIPQGAEIRPGHED